MVTLTSGAGWAVDSDVAVSVEGGGRVDGRGEGGDTLGVAEGDLEGVLEGDRSRRLGGEGDGGGDGGGSDEGSGEGARKAATMSTARPTDWLVHCQGAEGNHSTSFRHQRGASSTGGVSAAREATDSEGGSGRRWWTCPKLATAHHACSVGGLMAIFGVSLAAAARRRLSSLVSWEWHAPQSHLVLPGVRRH